MFVVIDYDPEDKMIYAVMPRIRIDKNKNVVLGNDRKTEQFRGSVRCICQDSMDGRCNCGAKQVIENEYAASFKPAKSNDKYQVISFKNEKKYGMLFEFVTKEMAKNMDTLYEPVCELEIYGNRHGKL